MEGFRQALGAVYVALGEAVGNDALSRANIIIADAIDTKAIDDPLAVCLLESLLHGSKQIEHV